MNIESTFVNQILTLSYYF